MADDVAIKVDNVSKTFILPHEKNTSVKSVFLNFYKKKKGYEKQQVLNDISFEVKKGEFFGIVGRNGSGKSTLLKLISQIYTADSGNIQINGKLTPFIELGVGFNPELSGRENVFLNGALLGFNRKEMESMYDEIVQFAELERFMDQKLKNYSSGMQVRLAFSIAIRANTDILVLDEVLAVGDEAFQRKCYEYFAELKRKKKTVILVTHDMDSVRKYCGKAMMIRKGKIVAIGSPEDVANEYGLENLNVLAAAGDKNKKESKQSVVKDFKVDLLSPQQVTQNDEVSIRFSYETTKPIETQIKMDIADLDRKVPIASSGSELQKAQKVSLIWTLNLSEINDTNVIVNASVRGKDPKEILTFLPERSSPKFALRRTDYTKDKGGAIKRATYSLLFNRGEWK